MKEFHLFSVSKEAIVSKRLEGPGMGVSGVDDPGILGSGVVALDFLGPLVIKTSALKPWSIWEKPARTTGFLFFMKIQE